MEWVFIAIVILFASVLKGLTGFGFALLAMPFLLIFYPAKLVIPVLTLFNLLTSTQIILKIPNLKLNRYTLKIPIWGIIGTLPGVVLLNFVEDRPFKIFVGSMLIIVSFAFLKGFRFKIKDPLRGSVTAGLTSGFLGGFTSISGPPLALFLTSLNVSNDDFRGKFAYFNIATATLALIGYAFSHMLTLETLKITAFQLPIMVFGILIGQKLSRIVSVSLFQKICILITLFSGFMTLFSVLHPLG